jgi:AcrR family transcriptional regulator
MLKHHLFQEDLINAVGISKTSFYRKFGSKTVFTQGEISAIAKCLCLNSSDVMTVF